MRQRVYAVGLRTCLTVLALLLTAAVYAQLPTTVTISDPRGEIDDLLRRGHQLEIERRWGEALTHYEDAVRRHPKEVELKSRFDSARLHYDIERRYADRSFQDSILRLSTERALNLYGQVLLKIESHYVEAPHWSELLDQGTGNLRVALTEPEFLDRNVPQRDRLSIDRFLNDLQNAVNSWTVVSRADARQAVSAVARLAQDRLEINPTVVILEYLCGATNALDPYSAYLTPDQLNEVYAQIEGQLRRPGRRVEGPRRRTGDRRRDPRQPRRAGRSSPQRSHPCRRRPLDRKHVDRSGGQHAARPRAGPWSTLYVGRARHNPPEQVRVERRVVEVPSVDEVGIIDRQFGIGYLKLTCFQKTTARRPRRGPLEAASRGHEEPDHRRPRQPGRAADVRRRSGRPLRRPRR